VSFEAEFQSTGIVAFTPRRLIMPAFEDIHLPGMPGYVIRANRVMGAWHGSRT
jgi:hypothetical protein